MARRGKYDLIIRPEDTNKEKICLFKDYDLYSIDAFCSNYKSKFDCISDLNKKGIITGDAELVIVDYKRYEYQAIFGNESLKVACMNTCVGKDSYGKDRLKVQPNKIPSDPITAFIAILGTAEGSEFSATKRAMSCVPKSLLWQAKRYSELKKKNDNCTFESGEEMEEMQQLAFDLLNDFYIYKNYRGIIVFIERFNSHKYYKRKNASNMDASSSILQQKPSEYPYVTNIPDVQRFNMECEELIGKEEFLDEKEYQEMMQENEEKYFNKKI